MAEMKIKAMSICCDHYDYNIRKNWQYLYADSELASEVLAGVGVMLRISN